MSGIARFLTSGKGLILMALVGMLILGIVLGPILSDRVFSFQEMQPAALLEAIKSTESLADGSPASLSEGFRHVAKSFEPFVVNVSSRSTPPRARRNRSQPNFEMDDLMDQLRRGQARQLTSLGSGTIVDPKGFIVTNSHVVTWTDQRGKVSVHDRIEVALKSGERFNAKMIGYDSQADIAVLKIEAGRKLEAAEIGDTPSMQIGDWVLAIGSPFGLEQTVTAGIVSAKGRRGDRFGSGANLFGDYIQTDAAINPGNSGGPLVNMKGQLIGINTFITTRSGGSQGIGFSIPSNVFVNAYNQLASTGRIERGWIGISMNVYPMTPEIAEYFGVDGDDPKGITDGDGVLVTALLNEDSSASDQDSPAGQAGIRAEDVIVQIGGREIESPFDLRSAVASTTPGESLKVVAVRKGKVMEFDVRLARRTVGEQEAQSNKPLSLDEYQPEPEDPKEIGLSVMDLSPAEVSRYNLGNEEGRVLIADVTVGSLADDAGLSRGQIITHINGQAVEDAEVSKRLVSRLKTGQAAILRVIEIGRENSILYTSFVKP